MELWFVLALLVAFLWGVDGIFAKLSTPKLGVARVAVLIVVIEGVMYFSAFYYWRDNMSITLSDGLFATASCMVGMVAYLCFFESVMEGQIAIVGTISAAYPSLTVIGALAVLSETVTDTQAIALAAIVGGVIALSYEPNPGSRHATPRKSIFLAIVAFILWGLWGLGVKIAIARVGPGNIFGFYTISALTLPLIYACLLLTRQKGLKPDRLPWTTWALGSTAIAVNVIGVLVLSFALEMGPASLVVPISSVYPLVTVIFALAFLREKLGRPHLIALTFVVVGLVLIGMTG